MSSSCLKGLKKFLVGVLFVAPLVSFADEEPPSIGNFALPDSQQPGPFVSFGQNIIDKGQLLAQFIPGYTHTETQINLNGSYAAIYGISDNASVLLSIPYALSNAGANPNQIGVNSLAVNLEYAFYTHSTEVYSDQATVVFAPTFPVFSNTNQYEQKISFKAQKIGIGQMRSGSSVNSTTYFFGTTYERTTVDWYLFAAPGVTISAPATDAQTNIKYQDGTQYYSNIGIGHHIKSVPDHYLVAGLVELSDQYTGKASANGSVDPNTGGNIFMVTPSLMFSSPRWMFQLGISLPISQSWYGDQSDISYFVGAIITWTIH